MTVLFRYLLRHVVSPFDYLNKKVNVDSFGSKEIYSETGHHRQEECHFRQCFQTNDFEC